MCGPGLNKGLRRARGRLGGSPDPRGGGRRGSRAGLRAARAVLPGAEPGDPLRDRLVQPPLEFVELTERRSPRSEFALWPRRCTNHLTVLNHFPRPRRSVGLGPSLGRRVLAKPSLGQRGRDYDHRFSRLSTGPVTREPASLAHVLLAG